MKRTEQKVLKFIEQQKLINIGDRILVAFSGGPDSVFALHFLNKFRKKYKIELLALHFNHGLRGRESDDDENFALEFCKKLGVPFISQKLDVKRFAKRNKLSVEEAARLLRYKNLEKSLVKRICNKIVTAHNQSDNTETILLNLFNGTGLSGLSGIPIRRENIIRPLLCLSKQEIVEYLDNEKINSRFDSSNLNDDFRRNYIRNAILPPIKLKLNPRIDEAVFRSSQNLSNALHLNEMLIEYLQSKFVSHHRNALSVQIQLSDFFDGEIPGEFLKTILKNYFNHQFEFDDYNKINSLVKNQKGKQVQLTSNLLALRESDCVRIEKIKKRAASKFELKLGDKLDFDSHTIGIELANIEDVKFGKNRKIEFISADNLSKKFILRLWKPGDKFKPLGMNNFKKVSDFLTNEKISSRERKNQFVLLNRNQIVWTVGLRIDDSVKLNSKTKKIYKLWVK